MSIQAQEEEFGPSLAAAAAVQQLKGPVWCCALDPQLGLGINSPAVFCPNYSCITSEQVEKELGGKDTLWNVMFNTTLLHLYSELFEFTCYGPKRADTTFRQAYK